MGNTVVWKPASTAVHSAWLVYKILEEAGLPAGVVNFVPGDGPVVGNACIPHRDFAGLHFTGSTATFNNLWKQIANNIDQYVSYPRIVGETGGKNFHFVHESADLTHVFNSTVRGAFEYQGQKCSATSRLYIPNTMWPKFRDLTADFAKEIKVGCTRDFDTFVNAVIDKKSFDNVTGYIGKAKSDPFCKIVVGGQSSREVGNFIHPTVIETSDPQTLTMREEIFGPVLTVYPYDPSKLQETLELCDRTSKYALTGAIFARDRQVLHQLTSSLRNTSGNFYVNDKSTGAVVGQQAFGGARASGTNDKSGSFLNLLRWTSVRSIKENFLPLTSWKYPHLAEKN